MKNFDRVTSFNKFYIYFIIPGFFLDFLIDDIFTPAVDFHGTCFLMRRT